MKAWEIDGEDVIRFVLRREEWNTLIKACASNAVFRNPFDTDDVAWRAIDVLRTAEVDINASRMRKTLLKIADWTKRKEDNVQELIHSLATNALKVDDDKDVTNK